MPACVDVKRSSRSPSSRASRIDTSSNTWLKGILLPDFIPQVPHIDAACAELDNKCIDHGIADRTVSEATLIPLIPEYTASAPESGMAMERNELNEPINCTSATTPIQANGRLITYFPPDSMEMIGPSEVCRLSTNLPACPSPSGESPKGVVVESEDMSARPPAVRTNMIVPSPSEHSAVFLTGTDHSVSTSVGPSRHHRSPENLTSAPSSPRLQTVEEDRSPQSNEVDTSPRRASEECTPPTLQWQPNFSGGSKTSFRALSVLNGVNAARQGNLYERSESAREVRQSMLYSDNNGPYQRGVPKSATFSAISSSPALGDGRHTSHHPPMGRGAIKRVDASVVSSSDDLGTSGANVGHCAKKLREACLRLREKIRYFNDALETSQDPQASEEADLSLHMKKREVEAALQVVVASRDRVTVVCLVTQPEALNGVLIGSLSLAAQVTEELAHAFSLQAAQATKELHRVRWDYAVLSMRHCDEAQRREWAQFALGRAGDKYSDYSEMRPTLTSISSMYKWLNNMGKE